MARTVVSSKRVSARVEVKRPWLKSAAIGMARNGHHDIEIRQVLRINRRRFDLIRAAVADPLGFGL